jgi:hypothetical protein
LSRLAPKDLERLSAYVDGALPSRERADVETRLGTDADLRRALAELRSVKASLAGLPQARVPRNFTLREADVAQRAPRTAFPYLRFATAVAGGLFVLTTAVRSLSPPIMPFASAPAPQLAAEVLGELEGAAAGTQESGAELRMEAPAAAAAPEESLADALAPAPTPTPAGTACPSCPASFSTTKTELGKDSEEGAGRAAAETQAPTPLGAAQWLLGLTVIVLGVLTVRARRR